MTVVDERFTVWDEPGAIDVVPEADATIGVWGEPGLLEVIPGVDGTIVVGTPAGGIVVGPPGPKARRDHPASPAIRSAR